MYTHVLKSLLSKIVRKSCHNLQKEIYDLSNFIKEER